jgi:hypothetical protein
MLGWITGMVSPLLMNLWNNNGKNLMMDTKWFFSERIDETEGSSVDRLSNGGIPELLWFCVRIIEVVTGNPVKQLSVEFEDGSSYSTGL